MEREVADLPAVEVCLNCSARTLRMVIDVFHYALKVGGIRGGLGWVGGLPPLTTRSKVGGSVREGGGSAPLPCALWLLGLGGGQA